MSGFFPEENNHALYTQKNKLPKIERDIAEAKVARKAVEILVKKEIKYA